MISKALAVGDIFKYLGGPTDRQHRKREGTVVIRGDRAATARTLQALCPYDLADEHLRRQFYAASCQHVMHSFCEGEAAMRTVLAPIIRATEDLMLAGLRRDALAFVAFYHLARDVRQASGPAAPPKPSPVDLQFPCRVKLKPRKNHVHIVVLNYLLGSWAPYDSKMSADAERNIGLNQESELVRRHGLLERFSHLCNLKFGLTEPLDPERLRLIHPGSGSSTPKLEPWTNKIEDFAWHLLGKGRLDGATFPEQLRRIGIEPVAAYDQEGKMRGYGPPCKKRELKNSLEVQTPEGDPIILQGLVVRSDFTHALFDEEIDRRRQIIRYFREQGQLYYARFYSMVRLRALRQKRSYGNLAGKMGQEVAPSDFDFLRPPSSILFPAIQMPMPTLEEISGPPLLKAKPLERFKEASDPPPPPPSKPAKPPLGLEQFVERRKKPEPNPPEPTPSYSDMA